jgi:hypothetical protein
MNPQFYGYIPMTVSSDNTTIDPNFFGYAPNKGSEKNVAIESELWGVTRPWSRCAKHKYQGESNKAFVGPMGQRLQQSTT